MGHAVIGVFADGVWMSFPFLIVLLLSDYLISLLLAATVRLVSGGYFAMIKAHNGSLHDCRRGNFG